MKVFLSPMLFFSLLLKFILLNPPRPKPTLLLVFASKSQGILLPFYLLFLQDPTKPFLICFPPARSPEKTLWFMFSFIYFILAFHLRKEFLHTPTTLNSASSQPTPPFCIWNIKIFSRPDFGVLNGFLQSFDHSQEEAWPGVLLETSRVGGVLFTPLRVATPQCMTLPSS